MRQAFDGRRVSGAPARRLILNKQGVRDRTRAVLKAFELQLA